MNKEKVKEIEKEEEMIVGGRKYRKMTLEEIKNWNKKQEKFREVENKKIIKLEKENRSIREARDFIEKIYKRDVILFKKEVKEYKIALNQREKEIKDAIKRCTICGISCGDVVRVDELLKYLGEKT